MSSFEHITDLQRHEQLMSAITHGLGVVATIIGAPFLIAHTVKLGDATITLGMIIFLICLLMVYLSSTIYHYYFYTPHQNLLRTIDHICIYFLIAGTNTPFIFLYHQGNMGFALMSLFWGMVVMGTLYKIYFIGKHEFLSLFLYVFMGWMGLLTLYPIIGILSDTVFNLLLMGGVFLYQRRYALSSFYLAFICNGR